MVVLKSGWMPEDEYSESIMRLHLLAPKMHIIRHLFENLHSVITDGKYLDERYGDLNDVRRKTYAVMLAMQILALTIELIDDFAAYCFAFYRARKEKTKLVAEYLRDWGTDDVAKNGSPWEFFRKAREDLVFVAEILGLHPTNDWQKAHRLKGTLTQLGDFRKSYEKWYQGYKHGQRALPVFSTPLGGEPLGAGTVWGIFMIPKTLTRYEQEGTKVYVDFDVSFLPIVDGVNDFFEKAKMAYNLWMDVRSRVHQQCFGNPAP